MTIDKLAIAIQKDFDNVHGEMAGIHTEMTDIRIEIKGILLAINELRKITEGIANKLTAYVERTNEIDVRLRVVEKRT